MHGADCINRTLFVCGAPMGTHQQERGGVSWRESPREHWHRLAGTLEPIPVGHQPDDRPVLACESALTLMLLQFRRQVMVR